MIVLWGPGGDGPFRAVGRALRQAGATFCAVDQRQIHTVSLRLFMGKAVNGTLTVANQTIPLASVESVYLRMYDSRQMPVIAEAGADSEVWQRAVRTDDIFNEWIAATEARVVNPPAAMASNSSKPYQTERIRAAGLAVPASLITTDPEAVLAFEAEHGSLIYKSISGVRSIVSQFLPAHRGRLDRLRWCPTQFQERIEGVDWRVHVVGDDVFPCQIVTDVDDYRYAGRLGGTTRIRAATLPPDVAARCVQAAHALSLPVAGVDLRQTPDGRWVCFEVNPSPGFTFYEEATELPIAAAIASYLQRGRT